MTDQLIEVPQALSQLAEICTTVYGRTHKSVSEGNAPDVITDLQTYDATNTSQLNTVCDALGLSHLKL